MYSLSPVHSHITYCAAVWFPVAWIQVEGKGLFTTNFLSYMLDQVSTIYDLRAISCIAFPSAWRSFIYTVFPRVQFWQLMDSMVWIVILCLSLVIFPLHCSDVTATIGIRFFPHQAQSVLSLLLIRSVTWFVQCWCSSLHSITHCRSPLDSIAGHPNNGKCAPGATYTSWITSVSQCLNFLTNKPYTGRRSESGPCSIIVAGCNESNYAVLVLRAPKNIPLMVLWLFEERHTLLRCPC